MQGDFTAITFSRWTNSTREQQKHAKQKPALQICSAFSSHHPSRKKFLFWYPSLLFLDKVRNTSNTKAVAESSPFSSYLLSERPRKASYCHRQQKSLSRNPPFGSCQERPAVIFSLGVSFVVWSPSVFLCSLLSLGLLSIADQGAVRNRSFRSIFFPLETFPLLRLFAFFYLFRKVLFLFEISGAAVMRFSLDTPIPSSCIGVDACILVWYFCRSRLGCFFSSVLFFFQIRRRFNSRWDIKTKKEGDTFCGASQKGKRKE